MSVIGGIAAILTGLGAAAAGISQIIDADEEEDFDFSSAVDELFGIGDDDDE